MKQDETMALWQMCQVAKRAVLDRGLSEKEAQQAAAVVWNHWGQSLLEKKTTLEEAGEWQLTIDSFEALKGGNSATQNWLDEAFIDFSDVIFLLREQTSAIVMGEGGLSIIESEELEDELVLCSEGMQINFEGFIFAGVTDFSGAIFLADTCIQGVTFLHHEDIDYADFNSTEFRKGMFV